MPNNNSFEYSRDRRRATAPCQAVCKNCRHTARQMAPKTSSARCTAVLLPFGFLFDAHACRARRRRLAHQRQQDVHLKRAGRGRGGRFRRHRSRQGVSWGRDGVPGGKRDAGLLGRPEVRKAGPAHLSGRGTRLYRHVRAAVRRAGPRGWRLSRIRHRNGLGALPVGCEPRRNDRAPPRYPTPAPAASSAKRSESSRPSPTRLPT